MHNLRNVYVEIPRNKLTVVTGVSGSGKSGFQRIFNAGMAKSLKIPANIKRVQFSFSPNAIRSEADSALSAAFGGVL